MQFDTILQYQKFIDYTYRVIIIQYTLRLTTADDMIGFVNLRTTIITSQ